MKPGRVCTSCFCCNHYPLANDAACIWCGGALGDDYAEHERWEAWMNTWWAIGRLVAHAAKTEAA